MTKEKTEEQIQKDLWEEENKDETPGEEEEPKKKDPDKKADAGDLAKGEETPPEEGKGVKKDSEDQKLETEEEKNTPADVKLKARVRKRQEEQSDHERRLEEAKATVYKDDDFKEALAFKFSDNKIEVEGVEKSLNKIAEEYPDVAALVKDAVGQIRKEFGVPLKSTQEYIENSRFWEKVEIEHPGARSMKGNKEFMAWMEADEDLQTLSSTGNPDDIIFVLDAWKKHSAPKVDLAKEAKKNILAKTGAKGSSDANIPKTPAEGEDEPLTPELLKSIWD